MSERDDATEPVEISDPELREIELAMQSLGEPLAPAPAPASQPEPEDHRPSDASDSPPPTSPGSPTLDELAADRRPVTKTVCEQCRNSMWFASDADLKCFCRVMHSVSWSTREPNALIACDGRFFE